MASEHIKRKILKHLSATADSWASTVEKVSKELGAGSLFVEDAMRDLVEKKQVVRASDGSIPTYQAPGNVDGKYSGFNDKRLDDGKQHTYPNGKSGPYDYQPLDDDIKGPSAV